ncbi:hypothetical protein [Streptomyces sp. P17]|uniref:hypothetical protein n=1 Tax=Streptomyces sp. P17 TaxID=3074716 RepID=UPI0028F4597D|nr:hypothetical protein [Streptomyces sp. P17]MDT9696394.1 hypothetical protein [Streptomyces sp. P17]
MRPLRFLATLCALTSCGIPTTGVVEAGGPASGVVPTIRVYFVVDDALLGVPRRTAAPVDVEKALRVLFVGPTDLEQSKRITTQLPLLPGVPTPPPTAAATDAPQRSRPADVMTVTERNGEVSVQLSPAAGELTDLAAAQIICTATAAQRVATPGTEPAPVSVTGADGRRVEGTTVQCPEV